MVAIRLYPFIGAVVALTAVVLAIIGISTTYWFSASDGAHAGLWQNCAVGVACTSQDGRRPAALAITVRRTSRCSEKSTEFSPLCRLGFSRS